jgi:long-subunit acyl-CoA synthetase (AMP-forming)
LFTTKKIAKTDNTNLLSQLKATPRCPKIIILRGEAAGYTTYDDLLARSSRINLDRLYDVERRVLPHLVCNLQFTSGTTGLPKAAMLTHQ